MVVLGLSLEQPLPTHVGCNRVGHKMDAGWRLKDVNPQNPKP